MCVRTASMPLCRPVTRRRARPLGALPGAAPAPAGRPPLTTPPPPRAPPPPSRSCVTSTSVPVAVSSSLSAFPPRPMRRATCSPGHARDSSSMWSSLAPASPRCHKRARHSSRRFPALYYDSSSCSLPRRSLSSARLSRSGASSPSASAAAATPAASRFSSPTTARSSAADSCECAYRCSSARSCSAMDAPSGPRRPPPPEPISLRLALESSERVTSSVFKASRAAVDVQSPRRERSNTTLKPQGHSRGPPFYARRKTPVF